VPTLTSRPSIVEFVTDPALLGLTISPAQETLLRAIYGLPMSEEHLELYRACTGLHIPPSTPPIVCYEAVFGGHERHLARGERGVIVLVAQDQRATKIAFGYIRDYLSRSPLLSSMVEEVLTSEITLTNGLSVSCFPCTLRSLRGWSIAAGVLDELAFFRLEGQADSDVEVQASIRRGMIAFPSTRLIKISTPYMKSGVLHDDFKRGFGMDDPDLLVWRASALLMNPSLRAERLERGRRLDPSRFAREYEAEFTDDLEAFIARAWVEAAVVPHRHALAPQLDRWWYSAAIDASGGGSDAFTVSSVHLEGEGADTRIVQDYLKGFSKPRSGPVDLEGVVAEGAFSANQRKPGNPDDLLIVGRAAAPSSYRRDLVTRLSVVARTHDDLPANKRERAELDRVISLAHIPFRREPATAYEGAQGSSQRHPAVHGPCRAVPVRRAGRAPLSLRVQHGLR
jgi:hypothetical protein